jgi:hypothetical protein
VRPIVLLTLLASASLGTAWAASGQLVECNYDLVITNRKNAVFDLDLRASLRWPEFRIPPRVRAAAEEARAAGCTVYAFSRASDGSASSHDRHRVLVACGRRTALRSAGFWFVPSARITTRAGNETSTLRYDGPAWLWPKPDFSDL